jgi:hypothetical protein
MAERCFAVTADGARYPTLTPARAWTILDQLCVAGDIIADDESVATDRVGRDHTLSARSRAVRGSWLSWGTGQPV